MKLSTFIARLILHIPGKHFPMIRCAGLFSSRWKHRYLAQARSALEQEEAGSQTPQSPTWAARQEEYIGSSPLICPDCCKPMVYLGLVFGSWEDLQNLFIRAGHPARVSIALPKTG